MNVCGVRVRVFVFMCVGVFVCELCVYVRVWVTVCAAELACLMRFSLYFKRWQPFVVVGAMWIVFPADLRPPTAEATISRLYQCLLCSRL